jgi:hypothetical protein
MNVFRSGCSRDIPHPELQRAIALHTLRQNKQDACSQWPSLAAVAADQRACLHHPRCKPSSGNRLVTGRPVWFHVRIKLNYMETFNATSRHQNRCHHLLLHR